MKTELLTALIGRYGAFAVASGALLSISSLFLIYVGMILEGGPRTALIASQPQDFSGLIGEITIGLAIASVLARFFYLCFLAITSILWVLSRDSSGGVRYTLLGARRFLRKFSIPIQTLFFAAAFSQFMFDDSNAVFHFFSCGISLFALLFAARIWVFGIRGSLNSLNPLSFPLGASQSRLALMLAIWMAAGLQCIALITGNTKLREISREFWTVNTETQTYYGHILFWGNEYVALLSDLKPDTPFFVIRFETLTMIPVDVVREAIVSREK